jgi:octaprenyl-diphosphate synthase
VDDSNTRRGSPTVNNLWSNKISVLVGDFLFSKTLTTLLDLRDQEALAIFSESAKLITEGELLQIERANDFNFEESNYFDLIYKKTACLFAASCELGVLSVIDDRRARNRMNTFGENLGMAFQIKDDLLDYVGDASKMGKPIGNDVRDRKITLPLIYALENASDNERSSIIDLLNNGIDKDDQVDKVIRFVHQLNGVNQADLVARSYANKALQILKEYPPLDANNSLRKLVEFTIDREN